MPLHFFHATARIQRFHLVAIIGWALGLAAMLTASGRSEAQETPASITVNAANALGPVNHRVFGHNMEAADGKGIFGETTQLNSIRNGSGYWDTETRAPVPAIAECCREVGMRMMRYPGGCLVHNFDWRKTVGPLHKRGDWAFGIDEFIEFCRKVGAEPMITISDYVLPASDMPAHAAQLVEYLNAPAVPEHPWAMKRKEWGHAEPYGVRWFELGNESNHGNHKVLPHRQFTPQEYAQYALATASAMRAAGPAIKIGIVTVPGGAHDVNCDWNRTIVRMAGKAADYVVIHLYTPSTHAAGTPLMQACMAVSEQLEHHIQEYQQMIQEECGRKLPLAVTEFNIGYIPNTPKPYRFSYGAALECADLLRIFLKPENNIATANYWQFLNGWWGMLSSQIETPNGGKIVERPAYSVYRLWGKHFGSDLVQVEVKGPSASFQGDAGVFPARGDAYHPGRSLGQTVDLNGGWTTPFPGNAEGQIVLSPDGALAVDLKNFTGDAFPKLAAFAIPGSINKEGYDYRLSFEARFLPAPGSDVAPLGIGLCDSRGWAKTHSAIGLTVRTPEWTSYSDVLHPLADAEGVHLVARLEAGKKRISGRMEIRNLKIEPFSRTTYPCYSLLTASASLSQDGKTLYLMVFNKSDNQDLTANIACNGFTAKSAKRWEVNGSSLEAMDGVKEVVSGVTLPLEKNAASHTFPAHSMTAIEFSK